MGKLSNIVFGGVALATSACSQKGGTPIEFPVGDGSAVAEIIIPAHQQTLRVAPGSCDKLDVNTHVFSLDKAKGNPDSATEDNIRVSGSGNLTTILPGTGYQTTSPGYGIAGGIGNDAKIIGDRFQADDLTGGRDHLSVIFGDVGTNDNGKTITVLFDIVGSDVDVSRQVQLRSINGFVEFSASKDDFGGRQITGFKIQGQNHVSLSGASFQTAEITENECSGSSITNQSSPPEPSFGGGNSAS